MTYLELGWTEGKGIYYLELGWTSGKRNKLPGVRVDRREGEYTTWSKGGLQGRGIHYLE